MGLTVRKKKWPLSRDAAQIPAADYRLHTQSPMVTLDGAHVTSLQTIMVVHYTCTIYCLITDSQFKLHPFEPRRFVSTL